MSNVRAEVFSEVEGRVATITLNRPEVMNAFDDVMHKSLLAEVERIERMRQPGRMLGAAPAAWSRCCANSSRSCTSTA